MSTNQATQLNETLPGQNQQHQRHEGGGNDTDDARSDRTIRPYSNASESDMEEYYNPQDDHQSTQDNDDSDSDDDSVNSDDMEIFNNSGAFQNGINLMTPTSIANAQANHHPWANMEVPVNLAGMYSSHTQPPLPDINNSAGHSRAAGEPLSFPTEQPRVNPLPHNNRPPYNPHNVVIVNNANLTYGPFIPPLPPIPSTTPPTPHATRIPNVLIPPPSSATSAPAPTTHIPHMPTMQVPPLPVPSAPTPIDHAHHIPNVPIPPPAPAPTHIPHIPTMPIPPSFPATSTPTTHIPQASPSSTPTPVSATFTPASNMPHVPTIPTPPSAQTTPASPMPNSAPGGIPSNFQYRPPNGPFTSGDVPGNTHQQRPNTFTTAMEVEPDFHHQEFLPPPQPQGPASNPSSPRQYGSSFIPASRDDVLSLQTSIREMAQGVSTVVQAANEWIGRQNSQHSTPRRHTRRRARSNNSDTNSDVDMDSDEPITPSRRITEMVKHRSAASIRLSRDIKRHTQTLFNERELSNLSPIPTREEIEDWNPRRRRACTAETFRPDLNSPPGTPWNKSVTDVFVGSFLSADKYDCEDPTKIRKAFISHLKSLRRTEQRLRLTLAERDQRAQVERRSERKRGLFHRRLLTAKIQSGLRHHVDMIKYLGPNGMSTDESDHENSPDGLPQYRIIKKPWRNPELGPWLRVFDAIHKYHKYRPTRQNTRGADPHRRFLGNTIDASRAAVDQLPENAYNPTWLSSLTEVEQEDLRPGPPYDFSHVPQIIELSQQYAA